MLDGFIDGHQFTIEMTMGIEHVYFPTEEIWDRTAPKWACGIWEQARNEASIWCLINSIPFDVDHAAWVEFSPTDLEQGG